MNSPENFPPFDFTLRLASTFGHAKRGFLDHTRYDAPFILELIETRFGLAPLGSRLAAAYDMTDALDLR